MADVVGRDAELRTISSWLDSRDARALVIEGEPGIGKTTLWRDAVRAARDRGVCTLSSTASASETRFAFATIADLFETHVDDVLGSLPPPQTRALAVALRREDATEDAPRDPATTAFAILAGLRQLASSGPVTVALDDVQWLDGPSAAALAFALRRLGDDDVRFVLARRATGETALPLGLDRHPDERVVRDTAYRRAAAYGDEVTIAACLLHRAELECRGGNFELAAGYAREGYELTRQLGAPSRIAILAYAQALAHGALGDIELARAKAAEARAAPAYYRIRVRSILGQLALSLGDAETAAVELRPLPDRLIESGFGEPWHRERCWHSGAPSAVRGSAGRLARR